MPVWFLKVTKEKATRFRKSKRWLKRLKDRTHRLQLILTICISDCIKWNRLIRGSTMSPEETGIYRRLSA